MLSKRVTVIDVAKHANVTAQTVSRVLSGKGYVSESTKTKVLHAVKHLNYIPSYAATALRRGMSRSIAIVFDALKNVYFSVMIDYLRAEIVRQGFSIQLLFSDCSLITEDTYFKAISHGAVSVISFLEADKGLGKAVQTSGVPLMIFGRTTHESGLDYVTTDDVQGGRLAAERLVNEGCKTFKYIVEGAGMTCAVDRFDGFNNYLLEHGFSSEIIDWNVMGEKTYEFLHNCGTSVGVFCFNDIIALKAIKNMPSNNENNRPKIIGYDNIQSDIELPIKLTTVGIDKSKHTKFAIDCIVKKLSQPELHLTERQEVKIFDE